MRYISEETLREFLGPVDGLKYGGTMSLDLIAALIEDMPAEDVAPVVHAVWVDSGDFQSCSNCRATNLKKYRLHPVYGDRVYSENEDWIKTPFCPYCGAKMDAK